MHIWEQMCYRRFRGQASSTLSQGESVNLSSIVTKIKEYGRHRRVGLVPKFVFLTGFLILITAFIFALFVISDEINHSRNYIMQHGRSVGLMLAESSGASFDRDSIKTLLPLLNNLISDSDIVYAAFRDQDEGMLAHIINIPGAQIPELELTSGESPVSGMYRKKVVNPGDGQSLLQLVIPVVHDFSRVSPGVSPPQHSPAQPVIGYVQLGLSWDRMNQRLGQFIISISLLTLVLVVLGIGLTAFLTRKIILPLQNLSRATRKTSGGTFTERIQPNANDEIADLTEAFNEMQGRLRTYYLEVEHQTEDLTSANVKLIEEIADREQMEIFLRESEERFRQLYENAPVGIYRTTPDGRIVMANPKFVELLRYSSFDELRSKNIAHEGIIAGYPRQKFKELVDRFGKVTGFEAVWKRKDGTKIHIRENALAHRDGEGTILYYEGTIEDITDWKKAEQALRESEERYALATRGASDGIWDWDLRSNTVYYSQRWKAMLGYSEHEIGDTPEDWLNLIHPDDAVTTSALVMAHLEGQSPHFEHEYRIEYKDGSYGWVLTRGLAVRDEQGKAYRLAGSQTDITDRKKAEHQLLHDALHDALTGLPNRAVFMDRLEHAIHRMHRRPDFFFAVLFLDLDRFKNINDTFGHLTGDIVLNLMGQRISDCLRPTDTVARFGGDEFTILIEDIIDQNDAIIVADRIQLVVQQPISLKEQEIVLSASIGIVTNSQNYIKPEELLRDADIAMYRAKSTGEARYALFDSSMRSAVMVRMQLEQDLRQALERQELHLRYHPIVMLNTGMIVGFETLLRWNHPMRATVQPADFIPLAEETGLIVPIGYWVLEQSCRQVKRWQVSNSDPTSISISINLSSKQIDHSDLIDHVKFLLSEHQINAEDVILEITESVIMSNVPAARKTIEELKKLGINIALDDFGTGYSSLSYLQTFPIDKLKIDQSFIRRIDKDNQSLEIVQTILALAQTLGMDVIAEGVETADQLSILKELNCQYGQGFYFTEPLIPDDVEKLMAAPLPWL